MTALLIFFSISSWKQRIFLRVVSGFVSKSFIRYFWVFRETPVRRPAKQLLGHGSTYACHDSGNFVDLACATPTRNFENLACTKKDKKRLCSHNDPFLKILVSSTLRTRRQTSNQPNTDDKRWWPCPRVVHQQYHAADTVVIVLLCPSFE